MSAQDRTLAERSARYRARKAMAQEAQAALEAKVLERLEALSGEVRALRNAVDNSKRPSTTPVDKPLRNGSARSARSGSAEAAPARAWGTAPQPPTGVVGAPRVDATEDGWRVLQVLTSPASTGAIRDALSAQGADWPTPRVTGALVHLQDTGQVTREVGQGPKPDRWHPVPQERQEARLAPRLSVVPSPEVHVTCQDYSAHQGDHRWDGPLGRFVCDRCTPATQAAAIH